MKNDYYVYLHKTLDGRTFYVGKGRNKRAWTKSRRSKGWNEVSSNGYSVEIYQKDLSEKDALEIENDLISKFSGLVNKFKFTAVKFDDYTEYFKYDPTSPSGLSRIKGVWSGRGYEKGNLGHCGYKITRTCGSQSWAIRFKSRTAYVHRIIWQLLNGDISDGLVVDHIDGNPLNNNISNLRVITKAQNSRNSKVDKDNTSGIVGVNLHVDNKSSCSYWKAAYCDLTGKQICKYFSIDKLGSEEAFRLACEYRVQKINELNEQGAGYTARHGK